MKSDRLDDRPDIFEDSRFKRFYDLFRYYVSPVWAAFDFLNCPKHGLDREDSGHPGEQEWSLVLVPAELSKPFDLDYGPDDDSARDLVLSLAKIGPDKEPEHIIPIAKILTDEEIAALTPDMAAAPAFTCDWFKACIDVSKVIEEEGIEI